MSAIGPGAAIRGSVASVPHQASVSRSFGVVCGACDGVAGDGIVRQCSLAAPRRSTGAVARPRHRCLRPLTRRLSGTRAVSPGRPQVAANSTSRDATTRAGGCTSPSPLRSKRSPSASGFTGCPSPKPGSVGQRSCRADDTGARCDGGAAGSFAARGGSLRRPSASSASTQDVDGPEHHPGPAGASARAASERTLEMQRVHPSHQIPRQ